MSKFFQKLLIAFIVICSSRANLVIDDECPSDTSPCPKNSECRPLSCLGYRCTCNEGFMPVNNKTECIKGAALGQKCDSTLPCLNVNAVCLKGVISLSPPYCQCKNDYINTNNLQCLKENGDKRFGQWCEGVCGSTLSCNLGFCQCQSNYRQRTLMEIQADPYYDEDCIGIDFNLSKCRGVDVQLTSRMYGTSISMTSTDLNADSTDTMTTANQSAEAGNDTSHYDMSLSKADNQTSNVTLPVFIEASTSPQAPVSPKVFTPKIQTTTSNAMETAFSSQMSTLNVIETITTKAISKSQVLTRTSNLRLLPTSYSTSRDTNTPHIEETSILLTKLQNNVTPSQHSSHPQVPVTATKAITTTVQIFQSIPTESTDQVSLSNPTTSHVPVASSSPATTGPTTDAQNQATGQILDESTSSTATKKHTTFTKKLPQMTTNSLTTETFPTTASISTKTSPMTGSIPTKTDSPTIAFIPTKTEPPTISSIPTKTTHPTIASLPTKTASPTTHEVLTSGDLVGQNVTKTPGNGSGVTRSPAIQTDPQPRQNSRNRISTEAIVIPSVLVIILAIIITSIIAIIVCRKRRSHISLSTVIDTNTYKLPRPSMMSQALTSAPSSPYDHTGSHPSYHYVNEAFEDHRL